jgi:hypothetical protein
MRCVVLGIVGVFAFVAVTPSLAQNVLKSEPFILAPYEVVLVQDPSCSAGKLLRVTGAIRGLRRRKACVSAGETQASLGILQ